MSIEFCIRLKLSVRVDCMIRFKVQFWFRKRLLNEELTVMRCQMFWIEIPPFRPNQIIESKCKATFRDAYWNLACFLLLAIMGISVLVNPKLNLCVCFVSVTFKASIGISDVENYLPVIIGHQNDLTNYIAPRLTSRISFAVPFRSWTLRSTFKWTHNGTVLPVRNFGRVYVRSTIGVLNIFPSILEDEGVYQSFISNELGTMFDRKFRMKFRGDLIIHLLHPKHYFVAETPHYDDDDNDCVIVFIFQSLGHFSPLPQPSTSQWLKESPLFFLVLRVGTATLAQNTIGFLQRGKSFQTAWGLE